MATAAANASPTSDRLRAAAPWIGLAAWAGGAVTLWKVYWGLPQPTLGTVLLVECAWAFVLLIAARDGVQHMFGPVFAYEILRIARRPVTFILRGLYVGVVSGMLAMMYLSELERLDYHIGYGRQNVPPKVLADFAASFFYAFQVLQFCVVAFLTPAYVAGAVADEKERKTLEFLLATNLRNREIVFGKLAARVATLLMYVLAGVPVLAFLQLFGGIDPELLLAGTTMTVITAVALSAWSICLSVLVKKARDAIALTYLSLIVYAAGSATLGVLIREAYPGLVTVFGITFTPSDYTDWLAAGNPAYLLGTMATGGGTTWVPDALGRYALFWGVVTALLLALAVGQLRAVALRQAYGGARQAKARTGRVRPAVGTSPVFWREVFVESTGRGGCVGWLVSFAILGLVFCVPVLIVIGQFGDLIPIISDVFDLRPQQMSFSYRWDRFTEAMSAWVRIGTGVLGALTLLAAAIRGASSITGERDRDTWISLTSTPLSSDEILFGKWWGCVLGVRKIYVVLLAVWALGLAVGAVHPVMVPFMTLGLAVYVSAFAWIGIFCSITARTTLIATIKAIMAAVFLGGGFWLVLLLCCVAPIELLTRGMGRVEFIESIAQLLLGATPPFVLGWLPLRNFERRELGPFAWETYMPIFGPFAPVIGTAVWAVFALLTAQACRVQLRKLLNRDPTQPRKAPRPRAIAHRPTDADNPST